MMIKPIKLALLQFKASQKKYRKNRKEHNQNAVEAMKTYLKDSPEFSPDKVKSFFLV